MTSKTSYGKNLSFRESEGARQSLVLGLSIEAAGYELCAKATYS